MNPDDLVKILDELGRRLGPTGEYVFALAVRQVYIDSLVTLTTTTLIAVGVVALVLYFVRLTRRLYATENNDVFPYVMAWFLGGLWAVVVLIVTLVCFTDALRNLLNPEYAALRDILGAIGR